MNAQTRVDIWQWEIWIWIVWHCDAKETPKWNNEQASSRRRLTRREKEEKPFQQVQIMAPTAGGKYWGRNGDPLVCHFITY
jgi:hypothetical protein